MSDIISDYRTLKECYEHNKKFREYVDNVAKSQNRLIDTVLLQATTYEYYLSILPGGCNYEP